WRKVIVLPGGRERQDSVRVGLEALVARQTREGDGLVLVHDAARPLLTAELVRAGLAAAREHGAAVAALPVRDALKRVAGEGPLVETTVDRVALWSAQTPQVFRTAVLRRAFAAAGEGAGAFTDDASLVEAAGHPVALFPGTLENVKLTLPGDLPVVEALLLA